MNRRVIFLLISSLICGAALAADATLTWMPVTTDVSGNATTVTGYKVYKGPQGAAKTVVTTVNGSTVSYVDTNLQVGTTCYVVSAVNAVGEGDPSAEGCKSVVAAKPSAPTLTVR